MIQQKFDCLPPFSKDFFINSSSRQKNFSDAYEYQQSDKLGQGSFGSVFRVRHKRSGIIRALKLIPHMKIENISKVRQEIEIMMQLDHPHIIKLFEFYFENGSFYLIMEICEGGDIFDKILEIGNFSEWESKIILVQVVRCLSYLHSNLIIHRDLKPENILFQQKNKLSSIYLIDFGLSCKNQKGKLLNEKTGTIYYVAPEVLVSNYDHQCDVWSVGVLLYVLLCGYPPFCADTEKQIANLILLGKFEFDIEEWQAVSEGAKNLIKMLLMPSPKRLKIEDIFKNDWVQGYLYKEKELYSKGALQVFNKAKLLQWKNYNWLKRFALIYISSQISTVEISRIKSAFLFFNQNQSGRIIADEIKHIVPDEKEFTELFKDADFNKNKFIDYIGKKFIAICMNPEEFSVEKYMILAFEYLSNFTFQYITAETIEIIFKTEGIFMHNNLPKDLEQVTHEGYHYKTPENIVSQYNGKIDFSQFKTIMNQM